MKLHYEGLRKLQGCAKHAEVTELWDTGASSLASSQKGKKSSPVHGC